MRKLYKKGGKIHPSPSPPPPQPPTTHLISLLPATILTLTAALSPQDKEVLAYLISCSAGNTNNTTKRNTGYHKKSGGGGGGGGSGRGGGEHGPLFQCNCFRCYMSYWARWDTSPNRQLIHEIIEEYEEGLFREKKVKAANKKREKSHRRSSVVCDEFIKQRNTDESDELQASVELSGGCAAAAAGEGGGGGGAHGGDCDELETGSLRRIVNFIGEKIWSVWN